MLFCSVNVQVLRSSVIQKMKRNSGLTKKKKLFQCLILFHLKNNKLRTFKRYTNASFFFFLHFQPLVKTCSVHTMV